LERLLVAMALATWFAVMIGGQAAAERLAKMPAARHLSRPRAAKFSPTARHFFVTKWLSM
jgi:hypothetical protein